VPPTDVGPAGMVLRPAVEGADDEQVAGVHLAARRAAPMPPPVHTDASVRHWISGRLQIDPVWVADIDGVVVGYARFPDGWLDDLYVQPEHQGQGIGTALLEVVKAQCSDGFCLWVFESNAPARAFYERHGLVTLEHTDGSDNEEGAPDVRMAWPGRDPLAFFRGLIDGVDAQLGDLLARRAALTAAVHRHKSAQGGAPERDPAREGEIAATLARRAPALGEQRLRRIVHAIITESLDAAAGRPG
jgi:GNAT superfamily N-acetyltransferase/chorismate mutase